MQVCAGVEVYRREHNILGCQREMDTVPGDGGSQVEAKLNRSSVVHYICAKASDDYFNLWLNMELLVPVVIDCFVCSSTQDIPTCKLFLSVYKVHGVNFISD